MRNLYTLYRLVCVVAIAALAAAPALAQNQANRIPCYTDEHFAEQAARNPQLLVERANLDEKIRQLAQNQPAQRGGVATKRIVPIVFHILYTASGAGGNVSNADVQAAVATINRDFSRQNGDTAAGGSVRFPGASMDIEFRLATKDPDGNCTNGITRHETELSGGVEPRDNIKSVYSWPTDRYFNVWVVQTITGTIDGAQGVIAGYAQFPAGQQGLGWNTWGVVAIASVVNSGDRTLSHEIGHCFNLYHTFQGECGSSTSNCSTQGDQVCDTPPMLLTQTCNRTQNTCHTDSPDKLDNIENFMSYDVCQNMFSPGQRTRVYNAINAVTQLQTLTSDANLIAAGVQDGAPAPGICPPVASFFAARLVACGTTPVTFYNSSYNGASDPSTRYEWIIDGSDSGTYHTASPAVIFTMPGVHTVSLVAINSAGRDTMTRSNYVGARPSTGIGSVPFFESFEAPNFPNVDPQFYNNWEITSTSSTTNWELVNGIGHTGNALRVRNSGISGSFSRYLTSPGLNLSGTSRLVLYFYRAHKRRASITTADKLAVSYSTDCGSNWAEVKVWSDDNSDPNLLLYTNPQTQTALWLDPLPTDWKLDSVILHLRIPANRRGNVRLRFESKNSNANYLYLDDISVGGIVTNVRSQLSKAIQLEVMPNPGTSNAEISWTTPASAGKATLEIVDAAGRIIGSHSIKGSTGTMPVSQLAPSLQKGVYLLRFRSETGIQVTRFVLE